MTASAVKEGDTLIMARHRVRTVVEGHLFTMVVGLEGFEIGMAYDGDKTWAVHGPG